MKSDQKTQLESTVDAYKAQEQVNGAEKSTHLSSGQLPSLLARSSLESTATTLPSYSEQSDQPLTYSDAGMHSGQSRAIGEPKPPAKPSNASRPSGPNAAAVLAVMAPSNPSTDKMHSQRSKKVDDWNKDPTYKAKLSSMSGSTSKWNYFGADIEQYGNPFKRLGRKR